MTFRGAARPLDDIDLPAVAAKIGVGEDEIHAVLDVETRGNGFDAQGRPKMLFEPHVFWRQLPADQRPAAISAGLATRNWGERPYPADSYPRLAEAMDLNREAALRSASWGLAQIMGFNCRLAGYPTAAAMVTAFLDDEAVHLRAMIKFIVAAGLDDELRRHDWAGFARGYNGPQYARHGYHTKLAARFHWWRQKPDTPWALDRAPVDPNACFTPSERL